MNLKQFMKFEDSDVEIISINNIPHFELVSVGMALGYTKKAKGKLYPREERIEQILKNADIITVVHRGQRYLTKDMLYDFMIEAHTAKCKMFKKWLTNEVLPIIEQTGAYIESGREQEMVSYYFSSLSPETQGVIVTELMNKNKELQQFYDDLMNTEGLISMNTVSKELGGIGLKTLFAYLRGKSVMFYKDGVNIPYQRFMNQNLFSVIESPCADGKYRPTTYATKKGLEYIRKMLRKDGFYNSEVA